MSINRTCISGNITRDAELRSTSTGTTVVEFSVAVNERRKGQDGEWSDYPNYIDCKMFGKRADALYPFLRKGCKVAIEGKLHQDRWQDKQTGGSRSKVSVTVDEIEFMSRREYSRDQKTAVESDAYESDEIPF